MILFFPIIGFLLVLPAFGIIFIVLDILNVFFSFFVCDWFNLAKATFGLAGLLGNYLEKGYD